jgi:UDP-N-acetyl-D-mannosaminuronic acid transferase (WecB/TagA/CpsF family)
LSFKSNQTILALPSDRDIPAPAPHASVGFSRAFAQASIEELCVIREWRIAIVNAVGSNSPASEEWISTQHRLAEKNLALACVGCFVFTSGLRSFAIG